LNENETELKKPPQLNEMAYLILILIFSLIQLTE